MEKAFENGNFGTANYFVERAGLSKGKLPCHQHLCNYCQNELECTVFVSVFGDIIRYDDPNIQDWYDFIVSIPPKLYMEMNRNVTSVLQKEIADPPCIDEEEPFGALMVVSAGPTVYLCISSDW
jgi:hypothetical protein